MMEFKKLSDVEVVAEPTKSANVLIEENGVIKKAPKTAVGGAGGSDTYYVFFDQDNNITTTDGLYDAIIQNLYIDYVGINVKVLMLGNSHVYEYPVSEYVCNDLSGNESISVNCGNGGPSVFLRKDGNHSYYWD